MTIDLFSGYAATKLLPTTEISSAYTKVLTTTDLDKFATDPVNQHPLNYGTDPGDLIVRTSISNFLGHYFDRPKSDPDCFNLTNGASFGIGMVLNRCTDLKYTERIFIVSPCYYLINPVFVDHGYGDKIRSLNETPEGEYELDLKDFERQLLQLSKDGDDFDVDPCGRPDNKLYKSLLYIVPTYSNPGSLTYSMKTRTKLLELARKHDVLIVCDDVYDLLKYDEGPILPRLVHMDRDSLPQGNVWGNVVSNSSTSKLLAPGLRFGWTETVNPKLATQLSKDGCTVSGGTASHLNSYIVSTLMDSGELHKIVKNYISQYSVNAKITLKAIEDYLPKSTKFYGGDGGYFIWVKFDDKYNIPEIIKKLSSEKDVIVAPGERFEVVKNIQGWQNCVRICFTLMTPEQIHQGIKDLGSYLKN